MPRKKTLDIKELLAGENGRINKQYGDISVLLVYPNTYFLGMSNLGFQTLYRLLNEIPFVRCERGFMADGRILVMESRRNPSDFDVIAFSISFELDYPVIVEFLRQSGMPILSRERGEREPLVIAGGAVTMINPEPIADLMDLIVLGEAEGVVVPLMERIRDARSMDRHSQLEELASIAGVYIPRFFRPVHDESGTLISVERRHDTGLPRTLHLHDLDSNPSHSVITTPHTEFRDMYLIEISRGCVRGCLFCAARYAYRPFRYVNAEGVISLAEEALKKTDRIGLVGTVISDHPQIDNICTELRRMGARISVSSFRADSASEALIATLAESGARTVTIAPETGTEELRRSIGKNMSDEAVFHVAEMAKAAGIRFIKLYFMFGLPGETTADIESISLLAKNVSRILPVKASVNPFVPKPRTRFERYPMNTRKELQGKSVALRKLIGRIPAVDLLPIGIRDAMLEAFYSRLGREGSEFLVRGRPSPREIENVVCRRIGDDRKLPWSFLEGTQAEPTS